MPFVLRPSGVAASRLHQMASMASSSLLLALALFAIACVSDQSLKLSPVEISQLSPNPTSPASNPIPSNSVLFANSDCTIADPAIDAAMSNRGPYSLPIISEIHAGLFKIIENGGTTNVEPELAEAYSVSEGGKSYRFILRRNLSFSDGSPLRANDVKWSWERALTLAGSTGRANHVLGPIMGSDEVAAGTSNDLSGIEIPDDRTLIVSLKSPRSNLLWLLSDPVAAVLNRQNVNSWGWEFQPSENIDAAVGAVPTEAFTGAAIPIGAGPFRALSYSPYSVDRTCVIERNPFYWGTPADVSYVVYVDSPSGATTEDIDILEIESQAYMSDDIDYINIDSEQAEAIARDSGSIKGEVRRFDAAPYTSFILIDPAIKPFDDINVRHAFVMAADIATAHQPFPVRWARRIIPESFAPDTSRELAVKFDPIAAKERIEASAYRDGFGQPIPIIVALHYPDTDRLQRIAERWTDIIGFEVTVQPEPDGEVRQLVASGRAPLRLLYIDPTYPDPNSVYSRMLDALPARNRPQETGHLADLIQLAEQEQDAAARSALHVQIERYIKDMALAIPVLQSWGGPYIVTKPWIHGFTLPKFFASAFHRVRIDDTAPVRTPYAP